MKVAFSKINITTNEYIGKAMAGYTRKEPCLGKLDDIYAYGVLIERNSKAKESNYLLMISIDTLKLPISIVEYAKRKITNKFKSLDLRNIIIHATHTHSSFDLTGEFFWPGGLISVMKGIMFGSNRNDKYIVWLIKRLLKMIQNLFENLIQCKVAWKKEKLNPNIVINRRHPIKKVLPDLGVICFRSVENNKLLGLIINYSCHPTSLSYKNNKLSADYPGRIIFRIDELTEHKVSTIYFNGPSGDLNPITTCGTDFKKIEQDKTLVYDQLGTYEHTEKIGYTIAEKALNLVNSISDDKYYDDLEFEVYKKEFLIPMKYHKYYSKIWFKNKLYWIIKKHFLMRIAKFPMKSANFPIFSLKYKGFKKYCRTLIQFVNIKMIKKNDSKVLGIMTIPGELFEHIGENLIKKSPVGELNTFIFQNTQDWIAYLFPLEIYTQEGGYEPVPSFSPLCGYYVEKKMLKLIKEINK
jgi:neutral ceramidase